MLIQDAIRFLAGFMILLSLILTYFFSPWFLVLAAFVALNLIQSAFTKTCPAMTIFRKLGLKDR